MCPFCRSASSRPPPPLAKPVPSAWATISGHIRCYEVRDSEQAEHSPFKPFDHCADFGGWEALGCTFWFGTQCMNVPVTCVLGWRRWGSSGPSSHRAAPPRGPHPTPLLYPEALDPRSLHSIWRAGSGSLVVTPHPSPLTPGMASLSPAAPTPVVAPAVTRVLVTSARGMPLVPPPPPPPLSPPPPPPPRWVRGRGGPVGGWAR